MFCTGPIHYIGAAAVRADIETFRAALEGVPVEEAFLPAVAPGTIEHWLRNEYYPSDDAESVSLARAPVLHAGTTAGGNPGPLRDAVPVRAQGALSWARLRSAGALLIVTIAIALVALGAQLIVIAPVFASSYNWFHLVGR